MTEGKIKVFRRPDAVVSGRRSGGLVVAGLLLLGLLAGCAQVVASSPDRVSVDTENYGLGDIMPGLRIWMAWLTANDQCGMRGKSPELEDMKGNVVIYRCVPR